MYRITLSWAIIRHEEYEFLGNLLFPGGLALYEVYDYELNYNVPNNKVTLTVTCRTSELDEGYRIVHEALSFFKHPQPIIQVTFTGDNYDV